MGAGILQTQMSILPLQTDDEQITLAISISCNNEGSNEDITRYLRLCIETEKMKQLTTQVKSQSKDESGIRSV